MELRGVRRFVRQEATAFPGARLVALRVEINLSPLHHSVCPARGHAALGLAVYTNFNLFRVETEQRRQLVNEPSCQQSAAGIIVANGCCTGMHVRRGQVSSRLPPVMPFLGRRRRGREAASYVPHHPVMSGGVLAIRLPGLL